MVTLSKMTLRSTFAPAPTYTLLPITELSTLAPDTIEPPQTMVSRANAFSTNFAPGSCGCEVKIGQSVL